MLVQARKERGAAVGYILTLPKELADDLGWQAGDVVEFVRKGVRVELRRRGEER